MFGFSSHKLPIVSHLSSRHVANHFLVIHGLENVVLAGAVVMAGARFDEHHVLLHDLSVGAFELHGQGGGPVWGTAATIKADTAELGTVRFGGGATGNLELHWLGDSWGTDAFFPFPDTLLHLGFARSHHAQSCLFLQSAVSVVIGNPCGDPQPTCL